MTTPRKMCPTCQSHEMTPVGDNWLCSEDVEPGCGHTEPLPLDIASALDPDQMRMEL